MTLFDVYQEFKAAHPGAIEAVFVLFGLALQFVGKKIYRYLTGYQEPVSFSEQGTRLYEMLTAPFAHQQWRLDRGDRSIVSGPVQLDLETGYVSDRFDVFIDDESILDELTASERSVLKKVATTVRAKLLEVQEHEEAVVELNARHARKLRLARQHNVVVRQANAA